MSEAVADDMIRSYFERWQRLEEEKVAISADLRELFAEMKGNGFDSKVARKVFRDKLSDPNDRAEFEAVYDLYWSALSGPRAGRAREGRKATTQDASVPAGFNPETGEEVTTPKITEPQTATVADAQSQSANPEAVAGSAQDGNASPDRREGDDDGQPIQPETANDVGEAQKVERRSPKPEDAGSIPATYANAGSSNGRTAGFDPVNAGSTPAPAPIILPTIPADFKSDQPIEVVEARQRRTLKARPLCQKSWSCGRMADQTECAQCLKAAQERAA